MKTIVVKDQLPTPGQEHVRHGYPSPGAYYNPATRNLYLVGTDNVYATCLPPGFTFDDAERAPAGCDAHRLLDQVIAIQKGGVK